MTTPKLGKDPDQVGSKGRLGSIFDSIKARNKELTWILLALGTLAPGLGWVWNNVISGQPSPSVTVSNTNSANVFDSRSNTQANTQEVVTVVNGLSDGVITLLREAHTGERMAQAETVALATRLAVTREAIASFFEILGERDVPEDQIRSRLIQVALSYREARDTAIELASQKGSFTEELAHAAQQIAAGQLRAADSTLAGVEALLEKTSRSLSASPNAVIPAPPDRTLVFVKTARAELASTQLKFEVAVGRWQNAVEAASGDKLLQALLRLNLAEAQTRMWEISKQKHFLKDAVTIYDAAFVQFEQCNCSVPEWGKRALAYGKAMIQLQRDSAITDKLAAAADVLKQASAQRSERLTSEERVEAEFLRAYALLQLFEQSEEDFSRSRADIINAALDAAGTANANSSYVDVVMQREIRLQFALTFVRYAKFHSVTSDRGEMPAIFGLAQQAMQNANDARIASDLSRSKWEFANAELLETEALLSSSKAELERAKTGYALAAQAATSAHDWGLETRASQAEARVQGTISLYSARH